MSYKIQRFVFSFFLITNTLMVFGQNKQEKQIIEAIKKGEIDFFQNNKENTTNANYLFSNKKSAVYYTIKYNKKDICRILLQNGADPNLIVGRFSLLEWAISTNRNRITRLLLEYGAEVNKVNTKKNTALFFASKTNNFALCKILVNGGANPLYKNSRDKLASDYTIYFEDQKTYKYLKQAELLAQNQDTLPSFRDGPYIYWEGENQIVLKYFERNKLANTSRLLENTISIGNKDTLIRGMRWDTNQYHIKLNYEPNATKINTEAKIFVMGDIHGRYNALINLLINNNIIDQEKNWRFDQGQLVFLGDVFDRGGMVTETLWFLHELKFQAQEAGGDVHLLLGNHEIMTLSGDHRYLHPKYDFFAQLTRTDHYQLYGKNTVLGKWLRAQNIILQINDYLFTHAGISPQIAEHNYSYADINYMMLNYFYSNEAPQKGSPEFIIMGSTGPLWFRGYMDYGKRKPQVTQEFINQYMDSKGLRNMVLGHNEQKEISMSFDGKIISVDVAINKSGSSAQGLLIDGENIYRCKANGSKEKIN